MSGRTAAVKSVVFYTQEYPTPNDPTDGVFTQQLADALSAHTKVTVVCPVPWWPDIPLLKKVSSWVPSRGIPYFTRRNDVHVYFPKVPLVPYLTRGVQPLIQALRAYPLMVKLRNAGRLDAINAHSVYPDGVAAALLASWLKVPLIQTAIGSDINSNLNSPARMRQIGWAIKSAETVIAVSHALCETLRRHFAHPRIYRIPNGINRKLFSPHGPRAKLEASAGSASDVLLFIGRLHPVKGLDTLLAALGVLKSQGALNFLTVIIGEGGELPALLSQASQLQVADHVRFIGPKAHHEVGDWLRLAKAFCLPSRNEGMPNVVIEAHACGVPVVASDVGGIGELVGEQTGILVPPESPDKLAAALAQAMSRQWSQQAICEHVAWADWEKTAAAYAELLRN